MKQSKGSPLAVFVDVVEGTCPVVTRKQRPVLCNEEAFRSESEGLFAVGTLRNYTF